MQAAGDHSHLQLNFTKREVVSQITYIDLQLSWNALPLIIMSVMSCFSSIEDGLEADSFKREVAETFLRCKQQGFDQDNAVIELNSLKIAEDRTFAEVARYVFITILGAQQAGRNAFAHAM